MIFAFYDKDNESITTSSVVQKFLNYRDDSRAVVAIEKLIMAMTRDVTTAISEVYMVGIALVFGSISKIIFLIG